MDSFEKSFLQSLTIGNLVRSVVEDKRPQAVKAFNDGVDRAKSDNFIENGRMGQGTFDMRRTYESDDVIVKCFDAGYRSAIKR